MRDFKPGRSSGTGRKLRRARPQPRVRPLRTVPRPSKGNRRREGGGPAWPAAVARAVRPARLARLAFAAGFAWLALGVAVEGWALWHAPLREVAVEGNRTLASERVVALAGLSPGMALSQVDPYDVALRLAAQPRVRAAEVTRLVPGRLAIAVREREPFAQLIMNGHEAGRVDHEGFVVDGAPTPLDNPEPRQGKEEAPLLPEIVWRGPSPAAGQTLADPALLRALAFARAWESVEPRPPGPVRVDGADPFGLVVEVADHGLRAVLPRREGVAALTAYLRLVESDAAPLTPRTVDLRMAGSHEGRRVVLRK